MVQIEGHLDDQGGPTAPVVDRGGTPDALLVVFVLGHGGGGGEEREEEEEGEEERGHHGEGQRSRCGGHGGLIFFGFRLE